MSSKLILRSNNTFTLFAIQKAMPSFLLSLTRERKGPLKLYFKLSIKLYRQIGLTVNKCRAISRHVGSRPSKQLLRQIFSSLLAISVNFKGLKPLVTAKYIKYAARWSCLNYKICVNSIYTLIPASWLLNPSL